MIPDALRYVRGSRVYAHGQEDKKTQRLKKVQSLAHKGQRGATSTAQSLGALRLLVWSSLSRRKTPCDPERVAHQSNYVVRTVFVRLYSGPGSNTQYELPLIPVLCSHIFSNNVVARISAPSILLPFTCL